MITDWQLLVLVVLATVTALLFIYTKRAATISRVREFLLTDQDDDPLARKMRHRIRVALVPFDLAEAIIRLLSPRMPRSEPPGIAEFIVGLLCKKKFRDGLLGDLAEEFARNVERFGERRAAYLYWASAVHALWPLFCATCRRRWLKLAKNLGLLGLIADLVRRHFS